MEATERLTLNVSVVFSSDVGGQVDAALRRGKEQWCKKMAIGWLRDLPDRDVACFADRYPGRRLRVKRNPMNDTGGVWNQLNDGRGDQSRARRLIVGSQKRRGEVSHGIVLRRCHRVTSVSRQASP